MTTLAHIATPAVVIDEPRMARNIERMQARASALGVRLRPHVKTSKCTAVAQRQLAAGALGITVSTLKEAEQFFQAGFQDILYAVSIAPHRAAQAVGLRRKGCELSVIVDSLEGATALAAAGAAAEQMPVLMEIDVDGHRGGILPESPLLVEIGRQLQRDGLHLEGVLSHAGSSYELNSAEELERLAEQERQRTVAAAQVLRECGLPCTTVSVGSTPTALSARHLEGVTELRAGVYVFFDLVMAGVGICSLDDLALSVSTTVIGHQRERGWLLVDAGWMAMSRDRGTANQHIDHGYGLVCDAAGRLIDDLWLSSANQEHGIVSSRSGVDGDALARAHPIGSRLRILPNHACATGAQHDHYEVARGDDVIATWQRFGGW